MPWRFPPTAAFQFGEWLREQYEAGTIPDAEPSPDLALIVETARRGEDSLVGPPPRDMLPEVPARDVERAAIAAVPELIAEVDTDTRNVVLTLARILTTIETGGIVTKDRAAEHLLPRVPSGQRALLETARDDYLGSKEPDWSRYLDDARSFATWCQAEIRAIRGS